MMLDETLQSQLRAYLTKIVQPVELIASLDESQGAQEMRSFDSLSPWEGADYVLPGDEKAPPKPEGDAKK